MHTKTYVQKEYINNGKIMTNNKKKVRGGATICVEGVIICLTQGYRS